MQDIIYEDYVFESWKLTNVVLRKWSLVLVQRTRIMILLYLYL